MPNRHDRFMGKSAGVPPVPNPVRRPVAPAAKEPSLLDLLEPKQTAPAEPGVVQKYGPNTIRGLGALLGLNPVRGFGIGAVSELGAEALENHYGDRKGISPAEIAISGVLGGMGGAATQSVMKAGSAPLKAALRAAPWGAAQPVVRHILENNDLPSPSEVLESTALNSGVAAGGAGLLKFLGVHGYAPEAEAPVPTKTWEIQTNARKDGLVYDAKKGKMVPNQAPSTFEVPDRPVPSVEPWQDSLIHSNVQHGPDKGEWERLKEWEDYRNGPQDPNAPASNYDQFTIAHPRVEKVMENEATTHANILTKGAAAGEKAAIEHSNILTQGQKLDAAEQKAQQQLADEDEARRRIEEARDGMVPRTSVGESISAPVPGGKESMSTRWVQPAEEEGEDGVQALGKMLGGPQRKPPITQEALQAELNRRQAPPPEVAAPPVVETPQAPIQGPAQEPSVNLRPEPGGNGVEANSARWHDFSQRGKPQEPEVSAPGRLSFTGFLKRFLDAGGDPEQAAKYKAQYEATLPQSPKSQFDEPVTTPQPQADPIIGPEQDTRIRSNIQKIGDQLANLPEWQERLAARNAEPVDGIRQPQVQESPSPASNKATFYNSRVDAAGQHYDKLKQMLSGGEPMPNLPGSSRNGVRLAGQALQTEAQAEGLPTRTSFWDKLKGDRAAGPQTTATPEEINPSGLSIEEMQRRVKGAGARPGGPTYNNLSSERGAIDPALMTRLGLAGAGAAAGAAADQDNHLRGALIGGAAGAALPALVTKIATMAPHLAADPALPHEIRPVAQMLQSREGFAHLAKEFINTLPSYQRAAMLTSPNLLNNAVLAPWASGIVTAMELHLAGDPRGAVLMKMLWHPPTVANAFKTARVEAYHLISDSERGVDTMAGAQTPLQRMIAAPATAMTTGDVAIRNLGKAAGLSEDEVRRMTLTSEPEWRSSKALINFQRQGGPFAQMLLPFAKTLLNSVEQGTQAIPGVGSLVQAARETPDSIERQLAKQAMGAGVLGASGVAGYEIPDDKNTPVRNRFLRSAISNAGGPLAFLSSMGFAAGRAAKAGSTPGEVLSKAGAQGFSDMPLPSTNIPVGLWQGAVGDPQGNHPMPPGIVPGVVRDLYQLLNPDTGRQPRQARKARQPRRVS